MVDLPYRHQSLTEMVMHPLANLKAIQGLDRLPDRRISRTKRRPTEYDPLRQGQGRASSVYKALGLYSQEESRTELYENYREMDYDAVIARVVSAFAEDGAQISPEQNRVVWVTAKRGDVKTIVEKCLARGRWEERAPQIMRAMARDGDVFMHLATARGEGVVATRPYEPWAVARIEDDIGRLTGFAPSDDRGGAVKTASHSVPYWRVAHFHLQARNLTEIYGAEASYLWGSRITWRQLQLMLDQVVVQRLLRRPDRLLILMDTIGMSFDDAHMVCAEWEQRLNREWYLDPSAGEFQNMGIPLDGAKNVVLPRGPNNATEITNFPATNQNDLLRDVDMKYRDLANGIGFPHGFLRGDGGQYNPGQSLSRQHQPFAKRASRLQRAFLHELVRVCMIDMAFRGMDVRSAENAFTLHMAPVSPILELEHHEIIQMKLDKMERYLRLGQDHQLNPDIWVPWTLRVHGGLPDDLVEQLYQKAGGAGGSQKQFETRGRSKIIKLPARKELEDALSESLPPFDPTQCVRTNEVTELDGWNEDVKPVEGEKPNDRLEEDRECKTAFEVNDGEERIRKLRTKNSKLRLSVIGALMGGAAAVRPGSPEFWEEAAA